MAVYQFVSPNTNDHLQFFKAYSGLDSQDMRDFGIGSREIELSLSAVPDSISRSVGDWQTSAEPGEVLYYKNLPRDKAEVLAALKGRRYTQKTVLNFYTDAKGSDILHIIKLGKTPFSIIRQKLTEFGISARSIVYNPDGSETVMIVDQGGNLSQKVASFVKEEFGRRKAENYQVIKGNAESIGDFSSRSSARKVFDEIISSSAPVLPTGEQNIRQMIVKASSSGSIVEQDIAKMLEEARNSIMAELSKSPAKWRTDYLSNLLGKVDQQVRLLSQSIQARLDQGIDQAVILGANLSRTILPPNTPLSSIGLSQEFLGEIARYRADLVKNLANDISYQVNEVLRRAMLSGKSLADVEAELGSVINGTGRFKTLSARAQTITRTEYHRMLNMSAQAGFEKAAQTTPMKKMWVAILDDRTRDAHWAAHGQLANVDEPYIVGGEALMYPGDPAGSAWNVINCRCRSVPIITG